MMQQVVESANRVSDIIKQSTHYSMLLNRKEDVYQIITTIGMEPGVEGIRIYNKRGEIMFSTEKNEEQTTVDMRAEACYGCHSKEQPLESLPITDRQRIFDSPKGYRVLGVINPIRNEPSCSDNECHAHSLKQSVLGVLDVRMSLQTLDAHIAKTRNTMIISAVIMIVVVSVIVIAFLTVTVLTPVKRLMKGAREISDGNLDHHIRIRQKNELGQLAEAFNEMTASLKHEKEENQQWAETLQERVQEKTAALKAIHEQILHIEKMASLGKLSATVAHELNNPLEAILTYAKLIARRLRKDPLVMETNKQTIEDIELIARETDRCGTIVKNLLLFSKKQVGEFALVPFSQIVEKSAELVRHHCHISNVKLDIHSTERDITLMCDQNQIQQALVALFVNAVEAMPDGGSITVTAQFGTDDNIVISVSDTGIGILPENLPHIFEPFFSTKKNEKGVGLGLSVVYGIVERHNGKIEATSEPGKGTTFTMTFPRAENNMNSFSVSRPSTLTENI
jgi:two-component system NtrC family sensor kinase